MQPHPTIQSVSIAPSLTVGLSPFAPRKCARQLHTFAERKATLIDPAILIGVAITLALVWLSAALAVAAEPQDRGAEKQPQVRPLRIISMGDWKASPRDVDKVLQSTAGELWKFFPERELPPIIVQPNGGPIVLYQRAADGELQVRLNTGQTYWSQYAYQFAHEFCHILCNYDDDPQRNKWFEESLCEMASIFAMRQMADAWKTDPPYPNWKNYSSALRNYADDVFNKNQLPASTEFVDWFEQHREYFYAHATDRPKNSVVARQLLPLFEREPDQWPAVGYLNAEKLTKQQTFEDYLAAWHRNSPEKHKSFIRSIAAEFKIELASETSE